MKKKGKSVYSGWNIDSVQIKKLIPDYDIILSKIHNVELNYLDNFNIKLLPVRNILDSAI